jgi:hypothetical protein
MLTKSATGHYSMLTINSTPYCGSCRYWILQIVVCYCHSHLTSSRVYHVAVTDCRKLNGKGLVWRRGYKFHAKFHQNLASGFGAEAWRLTLSPCRFCHTYRLRTYTKKTHLGFYEILGSKLKFIHSVHFLYIYIVWQMYTLFTLIM